LGEAGREPGTPGKTMGLRCRTTPGSPIATATLLAYNIGDLDKLTIIQA
jgi:hypothetical protein